MQNSPIELGEFDHYTLIVDDARAVAEFHVNVLGFRPARVQMVNAGSVPEGEYDMLNHILWLPGSEEKVMVVTEGLTEDSIFHRYWWRFGPGVHHVAYTVENIDDTLEKLRQHGVETTSEEILQDPVSGLKQIFLAKKYCGYFVELIERNEHIDAGEFVEDNMSALANTMHDYLEDSNSELDDTKPSVFIAESFDKVLKIMADYSMLPKWTGHKLVRKIDGKLVESRMHGDVDLKIECEPDGVCYTWSCEGNEKTIRMDIATDQNGVIVSTDLSNVADNEKEKLHKIISTELNVLAALIEAEPDRVSESDSEIINQWHLEIHQRKGL
ncbi:MAG: VOC family protein [Candidatus Thermoplasmatota archaeon]|nr:VOC family protein [Candidatus Thermoplasmatota archaeon]